MIRNPVNVTHIAVLRIALPDVHDGPERACNLIRTPKKTALAALPALLVRGALQGAVVLRLHAS